ncbi:MAG TPA: CxxC-x17-CxxC domain-containing protein [Nitrososphaeraceae archaeon]|nr:CxxC-x17-CxxC domain-containing protein [Nitrososphaeraceae archaeon]
MKLKGISLEMRLVSTKDAYEKVSHDRFIIGQNIKYNVPSYTTLATGRFSEIKRTNNYVAFMDYWNNKDSLDIIKDWPKIKDTLDKTRRAYEIICSSCGKKAYVKFRPDGYRPVYCEDCWGKRRQTGL